MKNYTLGFLFQNNKIILAKKKRKIGAGKWNGYGGRVEEGEDKITSLVREIEEESGVVVKGEDCKELGYVDFYFEHPDETLIRVYMYRIDTFTGEPKETEEMDVPEKFDLDNIPYNEMMVGDNKFLPFVIEGKKFNGEIYFSPDGKILQSFNVKEII